MKLYDGFEMNNQLKKAVDTTQRAQRNYDLSKVIPQEDLDTLVYSAVNSPSKQNETHYCLYVYTDQSIIREIYNQTKLFSLVKDKSDREKLFKEENGKFWQNTDMSVYNSQILANVIFVYAEEHGKARGGNSMIAQQTTDITSESYQNYMEQINYSIGISAGELILTAGLLGYKTGLCSAFPKDKVQRIIGSTYLPKLIVGIGYETAGIDRRLHAETLNKDVAEKFRTGPDDEHWRFPSFEKYTKVTVNGN
jgi:nitroreductase